MGQWDFCQLLYKAKKPNSFCLSIPLLYINGYVNEQMIMEFLRDIINNHPRLIIDTKTPGQPIFDFPIHTKVSELKQVLQI